MNSKVFDIEPVIAIVDNLGSGEDICQPFGKRWGNECFTINEEHLLALRAGKLVALDVQGEYVAFVQFNPND